MTSIVEDRELAAEAYDLLADAYDALTADYCHAEWLGRIEALARANGLPGRRVLDLACGTGKSFLPLRALGYEVTACDISPGMVEVARRKAPEVDVFVQDMRRLGRLGEFDLITCLDDAFNYLLAEDEIDDTLDGIAANLAPGGLAVFDVNTLRMYRESFAGDWIRDDPEAFIAWTGPGAADATSGAEVVATVHVFVPDGDRWQRRASHHHQRHWPPEAIAGAVERAGLEIVSVLGQRRGAILEHDLDELDHTKALYLLAHRREVRDMRIGGP